MAVLHAKGKILADFIAGQQTLSILCARQAFKGYRSNSRHF
jgi:hypothetical protein